MSAEELENSVKPRSRQLEAGNYLQTLLNSLTLDQIREAIFYLAPQRRIQLRKHADSEEALLKTGLDKQVLIDALLEVEARHPFKHCLLLRLTSVDDSYVKAVGQVFNRGGIDFRFSFATQSSTPTLTFEHSVQFKEWVEVSPDVRQRKTTITRQPIVVRVIPGHSLLTINYPGFTHSIHSGGVDGGYEGVVESLIGVLRKDLGFVLRTLPVKNTLGLFMEGSNRRVLRVKADVDSPLARLDVSAKSQNGTIEDALANFIANHLPGVEKNEIAEATKRAFNEASLNSIVLFWLREGLFTRLKFWEIGTELFFVWNKENPSYRTVDSVASLLASTADTSGASDSSNPLEWLAKLPAMTLVTPGEFSAVHSLEPSSAREILVRAMAAGLIEPVYRIKTHELIVQFNNKWTAELGSLKKIIITASGERIDGGDPENIEVAFQRIGSNQQGGIN